MLLHLLAIKELSDKGWLAPRLIPELGVAGDDENALHLLNLYAALDEAKVETSIRRNSINGAVDDVCVKSP